MKLRLLCLASLFALPLRGAEPRPGIETHSDIVYARPDGLELKVDLHLPPEVEHPPLVLFIHGGGWKSGSRKRCKLAWVAQHGYAVASIDYRLSQQALFPAQIHDCKGALRWLRANQEKFGYDASRVVVAGSSAGGHLAALMGSSGDVPALEGSTGGLPGQSSRVQGVIDYYGPTDFVKRSQNHPAKTDEPEGGVYKLLGGPVQKNLAAARDASPATYLSPDDPPFLILHGDRDRVVYLDQSELLRDLCLQKGIEVHLHIEEGAGHGWKGPTKIEKELVLAFLRRHLKPAADH